MKTFLTSGLITLLVVVLGAGSLAWWLQVDPTDGFGLRVPLQLEEAQVAERITIDGDFRAYAGTPSATITSSWPQFRGAHSDNIARETQALASSWPSEGPPRLWDIDVGEGYAGAAVHNGRVYVLDYDQKEGADTLRCFSLDDGEEIWRRWYRVRIKRNHGMSRTVPSVNDEVVLTLGPRCQVMCTSATTGDFLWGLDLPSEYGTKVPLWYTGQCPLLDGDVAVIAAAGKALMLGIDCKTGKVLWEVPNPDAWEMSHSSVMPVTLHGTRMYLYCAKGGMVAVAADRDRAGEVLWKTTAWTHSVIAPSPVQVGDEHVFLTAGYGVGSMMLKVSLIDGVFAATPVYTRKRNEFACEQHSPIYYNDHLFTVMPNDGGALKRQLVCMRPDGTQVWRSGPEHRYGLGPFMIADEKLLVMDNDGLLTMVRAGATGFHLLARAQVLQGRESWGPMALVAGRLIVRDFTRMICLDLR